MARVKSRPSSRYAVHNTLASIIIEQHKETMENDVDIIAFRKAELKIQDLKSQITDTILHFGGIELAAKNCSSCSGCRK